MIRNVATATSLQLLSLGATLLDRFVLSALLLRLWGVGVFEDWSVLFAAACMLNLLDLGLQMTLGNGYTEAYQKSQEVLFQRRVAVGISISAVIFFAGTCLLIAWVMRGDWKDFVAISQMTGSEGRLVLVLLGLAILLQTAAGATSTIYRAQGRFSRGLGIELASNMIRLVSVLIIALSGGGPVVAAAAYLAATAIFVLLIIPLDQLVKLDRVKFRLVKPTMTELRAIADVAPWFYAQHASNVFLLNAPLLVLGRITDAPGAIAMFLLLRTLVNFARQIMQALSNSIGVELSQAWAGTSDSSIICHHLLRSTRFICVLSGAAIGMLIPLCETLFEVWSARTVSVDISIAFVLGLSFLLTAPFTTVAAYLNYIGEARIGAVSRVVTALVALVTGTVLVGQSGVLGVALALLTGEVMGLGAVYLPATARWTGLSPFKLTTFCLAYCAAGFLPIVVIGFGLKPLITGQPLQTLVVSTLLLVPVAALVLYSFGMSKSDRDRLTRAAQRMIMQRTAS